MASELALTERKLCAKFYENLAKMGSLSVEHTQPIQL